MSKALVIQQLVQSLGLLNPNLSRADRSAGITAVCEQTGVAPSTVYNCLKRLAEGKPVRKSRADAGQCRVLDPEVQKAARALFTSKRWRNTPTKVLQRVLAEKFPTLDVKYDPLQRLRDTVDAELARYGRVFRTIEVGRPNEQWGVDCSPADFFCVLPGGDVPVRCQLTVVNDNCTRAIMYARYSATTGWDQIGGILHQAIRKQSDQWFQCGIPDSIVMDWGKVFVGHNITDALDNLGIERILSRPYYPLDKAKTERVIGSIHRMAEALMPGYCGSDNQGDDSITPRKDFRQDAPGVWFDKRDGRKIYTLDEANAYLWAWISGFYNHEHVVRTLGMTPAQAWAMHAIAPRMFSESFLEMAFLSRKTPTVRRGRVACNGLEYLAPTLCAYNGLKVEVRFDPGDIREVYVYFRGEKICTAVVDNPLFTAQPLDLKQLEETRRHNRQVAKQRRDLLNDWQHDITAQDATDQIHEILAASPAYQGPDAVEHPDPVPGLSQADAEALDGLYMGDLPLASNH